MKRIPLPRTFMLISILGILIVSIFTFNPFFVPSGPNDKPKINIDLSYGIAFDIVFFLMLVASILSITPPGIEPVPAAVPRKAMSRKKKIIKH